MLKIKAMVQEHTSMLQWKINLTIVHVTMKGNGMFPENITKWQQVQREKERSKNIALRYPQGRAAGTENSSIILVFYLSIN